MSRATRNQGLRFAVVLAVLAAAWALGGCSEREPSGQPSRKAGAALPPLFLELRVNGQRVPRLTPDLPLYLACTIQTPQRRRRLELPGLAGLRPVVRRRPGGEAVNTRWLAAATKGPRLEPSRTLLLYWALQGSLAPGSYLVGLEGADKLVDESAAGSLEVRVRPVWLEVIPGRAPPEEVARLRRRILALQGKRGAYLEAVRRALALRPQSLSLRWELVQALQLNQHPAQALRELTSLLARAQRLYPDRPPSLPCWCSAELRRLATEAGGGKAGP